MRLVFIHGRGQAEQDPKELRRVWLGALGTGLAGRELPAGTDVRMPFYGKLLDDLVQRPPMPGEVISRGGQPGGVDPFEGMLLLEIADRAGITDEEIAAEAGMERVPRGPENWPWVQAAARVLSRRVPWLGQTVLPTIPDVHAYLTALAVTEAVNDTVTADLDEGPVVVVGHSLGSVVAYWVLTERVPHVEVPLLVTLGSPLGIDVVKKYLPRPLGMPSGVAHWLNGVDERDPVALYSRLDRDTFPAVIENLSDIHNPRDNPHGIAGYLSDPVVATRILAALSR